MLRRHCRCPRLALSILSTVSIVVVLLAASAAHAQPRLRVNDTYVFGEIGPITDVISTGTGSSTAAAQMGAVVARSNAPDCSGQSPGAVAAARDYLTITAEGVPAGTTGTMTAVLTFEGVLNASASYGSFPSSASAEASYNASARWDGVTFFSPQGSRQYSAGGTPVETGDVPPPGGGAFVLPIVFGDQTEISLGAVASAESDCFGEGASATGTTEIRLTWTDITSIRDADGNEVLPVATVASLSDFDWVTPEEVYVRCFHEPVFPNTSEAVTVRAAAMNDDAEPVTVDRLEVFVDDNQGAPASQATDTDLLEHVFTPSGGRFSYGCRLVHRNETETSWHALDQDLRIVDVGVPDVTSLSAIPIGLSGPFAERADLAFFADNVDYTASDDPAFLDDVHDVIYEGFFTIPWFVRNQWLFNFWIGTEFTANAQPDPSDGNRCFKTKPDNYDDDYSWAQAAVIVHTTACRDGARGGAFTIETEADRLQVVGHEAGHLPFGLNDEYPGRSSYRSSRPLRNVFESEAQCRDDAPNRAFAADDCRLLGLDDEMEDWWLPEPDYRSEPDRLLRVRDLMQQTGAADDGMGGTIDRYRVGPSEIDKMQRYLSNCRAGEC